MLIISRRVEPPVVSRHAFVVFTSSFCVIQHFVADALLHHLARCLQTDQLAEFMRGHEVVDPSLALLQLRQQLFRPSASLLNPKAHKLMVLFDTSFLLKFHL